MDDCGGGSGGGGEWVSGCSAQEVWRLGVVVEEGVVVVAAAMMTTSAAVVSWTRTLSTLSLTVSTTWGIATVGSEFMMAPKK